MINRFTTRSLVILLFTIGAIAIAYLDPSTRPAFFDLSKIALGGYLGQLVPKQKTSAPGADVSTQSDTKEEE